jgi:hypothetical protein
MTDRARRHRTGNRPTDALPEEDMSTQTVQPEVLVTTPGDRGSGLLLGEPASRISALRPLSPAPTVLALGVIAVGFILIGIAWRQVAVETQVALQLPYLISGGLFGLALVIVGATGVVVAAKRRDAAMREQQTMLLADALNELRTVVERGGSRS